MTSGQVIGRHEVFEYTYRLGPNTAEERKRIKLVVIQRREQRRKSLIAAAKAFERTPVRLRVNLHRAQYGDPEVVAGSRHIPITLRRKVKPAATTTVRHASPKIVQTAPTTTVIKNAPLPSPPISEPTRIELVDRGASPVIADPPPVVIIPPSNSGTPLPEAPPSLSRSSSASSVKRPKVKRSGSFTGFRRFPSLMGMIRRNSKSTTPPSIHSDDNELVVIPGGGYVDADTPPITPPMIVEERESELGSPIAPSARYGPPSVAGSGISRKPVPTIPESVASGRSRTWSFGRGGSSPRNKLIKASPHQVPLPDSLRHSNTTGPGSPQVVGTFPSSPQVITTLPAHTRQSAEYEHARSVTSRHTAGDRSAHAPEYAETYLHDSPSAQTRSLHSLHDGSSKGRSIHDGASVRTHNTHNRSLHDISPHNRSAHDLSMRTPSRHSHEASLRRSGSLHDAIVLREINHSPSLREHSVRDPSVRELSTRDEHSIRDPSLHEHSIRDPSIREASIRDPSIREQSLRGGGSIRDLPPSIRDGYHSPSIRDEFHSPSLRDGFHSPSLLSPSMSNREILSDGDRENDHTHNYERESPLHSRVGSPSLHAPSRVASPPLYYRDGVAPSHRGVSPSLHAPSHRGVSPSLHAPSHRGASPSLHAPSYRGDSPSLHEPSRGVSPSLHAPSRHGSPPVHGESPNASLYAPSERSRHAGSVTSSKYPMSSINGRTRPKSPLSGSGSSNGSSRRTNTPRGPEITPVPMAPASVVSQRTSASRNPAKSPLSRVASPPTSEAPLPIIPNTAPSAAYGTPLPPSTYAPSTAPPSRVPSAAAVSRASAPASRIPTAPSTTRAYNTPLPPSTYAPSETVASSVISRTTGATPQGAYRTPPPPSTYAPSESVAPTVISRAASRAHNTPLPPSTYAPSESVAPTVISRAHTSTSRAYKTHLPPSTYAPSETIAPTVISRATSRAHNTPLPPSTYAPSESVAPTVISRAPTATSRAYKTPLPPSTYAPSETVAPTVISRTTSRAHNTPLPPSTYAPSETVAPTVISRTTSRARNTHLPPSTYAPSEITRAPSAAGVPLPPSRNTSAAGFNRSPVSQRVPPSVIGGRRVPPSITGSAPSIAPSRHHTPPPDSAYHPAPSDIAPESESHGGQALRAQARLEGDKMGMFFQMSQEAHKEGDGARAKELADIGRQHQVKMQELHAEAASQIFKEKNAYRDPDEIDLHGLYVKEALARLSQFIREAPPSGQTTLRVITGKGLHSDRGQAQIIPAVEEALRTKGLRHHTDEANSGVIVVELGPRSPVSE